MALYSLMLFVHLTAVLGLSVALSFEVLSLFHHSHLKKTQKSPWPSNLRNKASILWNRSSN
jgi:hypothetical protein